MQEMDRRLGLLRLMLADITDREKQAQTGLATLRTQLKRIVDFTVQFNGGVGNALAGMGEVEERIARQEAELRHLGMLRQRAESEIHALIVTRGIADARTRLAGLETRRAALRESEPLDAAALAEIEAEIAALQAEIHSASQEAARSLTSGSSASPEPPRRG
ncbi:MAG TPA: hypothetical protein VFU88_09560 [Ktedonobacterales bacterium]|nr:hypothetical protein [Ktedonobacterales bacterium]